MLMSNIFCSRILPVFFVFFFTVLLTIPSYSESRELVSAQYVSTNGKQLTIQLTVHGKTAVNLIVEQYISTENTITSTLPKAKKVSSKQGKAKWLLTNTRRGTITLTTFLTRPLQGKARAIIRYRTPKGGGLTELRISS